MPDLPSPPPSSETDRDAASTTAAVARLADLIERRVAPALERIAAALERQPAGMASTPAELIQRATALAGIRQAIAESRWDHAEAQVEQFARDFPDDPEKAALRSQVEQGREQAIGDLRARLDASRRVNDPESVIALTDDLTLLLRGEARRELEQDVVRWLIGLIQRRMRTGTVQADVVQLATRVAERFGATTEGASVRASLPTLRRSAGLCPRCGNPYTGIDEACPRCLAGPEAPAATPPNPWAEPEEEADESPDEQTEGDDLRDLLA